MSHAQRKLAAKAALRRAAKDNPQQSIVGWMYQHPWMTFFIIGGVIGIPAAIVRATRSNTP